MPPQKQESDQQLQKVTPPEHRLIYPPFPEPPPGITLVPFKDFKERGIQIFPTDGDDIERDGLGIPTVSLFVRHETDKCKTETRRHAIENAKRKEDERQKLCAKSKSAFGSRRDWWEDWADKENSRMSGPYDPKSSLLDRLYEAGSAFRRDRQWQAIVSNNWDQFRLYVGMLSNTPVWTRTDKPKPPSDFDSDVDDEEALEAEAAQAESSRVYKRSIEPEHHQTKRIRPRPPYALYDREPIPVSSEAEVTELVEKENVRREGCMVDFLDDPEEKIRIFLGSYMRSQGLLWYDRNLVGIPHLLHFWVKYLLRNRVFPEPHIDKSLRKALDVIEVAQRELILTSKLSKELPDKFGVAARTCWGSMAEGFTFLMRKDDDDEPKDRKNESETRDHVEVSDDSKRLNGTERQEKVDLENLKIIDDDTIVVEGQRQQALEDNVVPGADAVPSSVWSAPAEQVLGEDTNLSWGSGEADANGGADTDVQTGWDTWDTQEAGNLWTAPALNWEPPEMFTLVSLLGPTALPNTHTTGIVEWSVRRIKSVKIPPPEEEGFEKTTAEGGVDVRGPDAVEAMLERKMAKVVLEPWVNWERDREEEVASMAGPRILKTSRGEVVGEVNKNGKVREVKVCENGGKSNGMKAAAGVVKAHNPFKDDVTLLIERTAAETGYFSVGMGIGGTWVQLVQSSERDGDGDGDGEDVDMEVDGEVEEKKKKKKAKKKAKKKSFWYVDEVLMVLPSYYT